MSGISANLVAAIFLLLRFTLPVSTAYCFSPGERDSAAQKNIRFLAITDTHIAADSDLLRFRAFLNTVKDRDVEFVIILGDLAAHAPEYIEPIKEIAGRAGLPVYMLPGNHDDNYARNPEWWSSVFGSMNYSFEHRGFHFIMNWSQDTVASLCWLRACLDSIPSGEPIVFCQHFYPQTSAAPDGGPWPLLKARADDLILALSGHAHSRFTDTVGTIRSETLANCYMDTTGEGFFYEIALSADRNISLREFPLSSLSMVSPPDDPPIVALDQDSGYFVFEDRLELSGRADDDGTVESVEWRLDDNPWRPARGTVRWQVSLSADERPPGHHLLQVRARDNLGQATAGFARAVLYVPEKEPPSGTVVLRQGLGGYEGCRDVTVRGHDPQSRAEGQDLECWVYGPQGRDEFSEFYIAFDLSGLEESCRTESRIKNIKLILYCSRQNRLSPEEGDDLYRVGIVGGPWSEEMNYHERPRIPGWRPGQDQGPAALLEGEWPVPDPRQEIRPEVPLALDLTPFVKYFEQWIRNPDANHGWVVSPVFERYNISFRSSEYIIPTMRPRLEITFE